MMQHLIDSKELDKRTKEYIKEEFGSNIYNQMYNTSKENWSENDKIRYRNARSNVYSRMRAELKMKSAKLWFDTLTAGNLRGFCIKHKIFVNSRGETCCTALADELVVAYLKDIFIPALENELGIKGVTVTRNASARAFNCLDFSKAEAVEIKDKVKK